MSCEYHPVSGLCRRSIILHTSPTCRSSSDEVTLFASLSDLEFPSRCK